MRAAVRVTLSLLMCFGIAPAVPALGSVTESESRSLPRLLSDDDTLVGRFPGSATRFGSHLTLEQTRTFDQHPDYDRYTWNDLVQGLVQVGSRWKFAYLASGPWQGVVLGAPNGLGLSVQYRQELDQQDEGDYDDRLEPWEEPQYDIESSSNDVRQLRFGVGWRRVGASGRSFEVAAGASWLDAERKWQKLDSESGLSDFSWESDLGYAFYVAVRSLHPESGLQAAVTFDHEEPDPVYNWDPNLNGKNGRSVAQAQLGWRLDHPEFDDLVFGLTSRWEETNRLHAEQYCCGYPRERATLLRRFHGLGFISLQRQVVGRLTARGGVRSGVQYFYKENASWVRNDSSISVRGDTQETWSMVDPQIRLGARWTWKRYVFDLFLHDHLSVSSPILGWALRVDL